MMEFYRFQQRAVQLYDVNHSRKAGDAYRQHQMDLSNWQINEQSVAVLTPMGDWTQHMQGTKSYPTMPLVLPLAYNIIDVTKARECTHHPRFPRHGGAHRDRPRRGFAWPSHTQSRIGDWWSGICTKDSDPNPS